MTERSNEGENANPTPATDALLQRIDALFTEVRRQGRAGVAAQAAAEACLKGLEKLQSREASNTAPGTREESLVTTLQALLPVFDALDGAANQARRWIGDESSTVDATPHRGLLQRAAHRVLAAARSSEDSRDRDLHELATGVVLIQSELRRALERLGVGVESESGVPVDPDRHRVVNVRSSTSVRGSAASRSADDRSGAIVLDVLRPGYSVNQRVVREADVVASSTDSPHREGRNG